MKKYFIAFFLFTAFCLNAQVTAFQHNYAKGNNAHITTFTELKSLDFIVGYTIIRYDTSHLGPHTMELHLLKLDRSGYELWDKILIKDTTRFTEDRFTTQDIAEQEDGSLLLDITYPYGEKYLAKFDGNGNAQWNTYLHNSFGDFNVIKQLIKERGTNIILSDGSAIVLGSSFTNIDPKATLTTVQAGGVNPYDFYFYNGYFNQAYYLNNEHVYTVGVEQIGLIESFVFSDIQTNGGVNYHLKKTHKSGEKILTTALCYTTSKIRVAESVSQNDTAYFVNVYDYDHAGKLIATTNNKLKCAATCIFLSANEVDWVLSNQCNAEINQTIVKNVPKGNTGFNYSDSFDNVVILKKLHDGGYAFAFQRNPGLNLWKLNGKGSLESGVTAEGAFAPNPAKDYTTLIGNADTYNHNLSIKLCDMLGNTVRTYSFEKLETPTLNLRGLREGIYVYNIITDAGVKLKGKIVIYQKN